MARARAGPLSGGGQAWHPDPHDVLGAKCEKDSEATS